MKTYNEIVDNLESLEKETPKNIANALTEAKSYTDTEVADGVQEAKTYADAKFSLGLKREIVESLPTEDIDTNTIYMVLDSSSSQVGNVYNEYIYINSNWELIGTTATASVALYQHNITIRRNVANVYMTCTLTIINNSPSQFDGIVKLENYLRDKGLTSNANTLSATGVYDNTTAKYIIIGVCYLSALGSLTLITVDTTQTIWEASATIVPPTNATFTDLVVQIN